MALINQNVTNLNNVKTASIEQGGWPFFSGEIRPDEDVDLIKAFASVDDDS